ncbi:phosphopantetheine-binding protein, partial [Streptomyces sp. NPDC006384]
ALPDYMIPSLYVQVDAIPLTANGKLDHRALPTPDHTTTDTHVAPRTPAEERIAAIWMDLLGKSAGVHDGFFEVGGHSILAVRLVSRLRQDFDLDLPIRVVFERPTIAQIAAEIEDRVRAEIDAQLAESR